MLRDPHSPIHPIGCSCKICWPMHPADRRRRWPALAMGLAVLWAFPGRWLIAALWAALSPLLSR
jgi:hypothetical protein